VPLAFLHVLFLLVSSVEFAAYSSQPLDGVEYFAGDRSITRGPALHIKIKRRDPATFLLCCRTKPLLVNVCGGICDA